MLPESEFARLKAVPGARAARVEAGRTLFEKGAPAAKLYVLVSGALVLERTGGGKADVRGAGSIVGEIGALSGRPHPYTARATAAAVLLAVPAAAVDAATERSAGFARSLLRTIAERA